MRHAPPRERLGAGVMDGAPRSKGSKLPRGVTDPAGTDEQNRTVQQGNT